MNHIFEKDEVARYEKAVQAFLSGDYDAERFMALRLQHGVYGQRQEGVQMVRVKIPGGALNAGQLRAIADVQRRYSSSDCASVTTRQDFQLHYIPLQHTGAVMRRLGEVALTTREACGNTVRNITACPLAGVCPNEHTDVATHVNGTMERFLRHPLTQHLPRKFKMSFSGCESDCAMGMMHDVGVVATVQGSSQAPRFGFKILAAGGLGHKPREAITVEPFIEEPDLLPCIEALIALHNRYSDRKRRARARLKFLVDRLGAQRFLEEYHKERQRSLSAFEGQRFPQGEWQRGASAPIRSEGAPRQLTAQKQRGLNIVPISLPGGAITAAQLEGVAAILRDEKSESGKHTSARTTVDQNLILVGVADSRLAAVQSQLQQLELHAPQVGDDVVACPGTSTCRLGITSSKLAAQALNGGNHDLRIRVSGCHNSCAQHHVGDIGLHGEGKRLFGRLIPHYALHIGGNGCGDGSVAMNGPEIPTQRIAAAIEKIQQAFATDSNGGDNFFHWSRSKQSDYFQRLLADLSQVREEDAAALARDLGGPAPFKVLQLGGGECAGAAQELIASNFSEAAHERGYRDAFILQRRFEQALECCEEICRLVGNSLLFVSGHNALHDLAGIGDKLASSAADSEAMDGPDKQLSNIVTALRQLRELFDAQDFEQLNAQIDRWTNSAAQRCQRADVQLDLSHTLPSEGQQDTVQIIDLSAFGCPLHYIKARNELRKFDVGDEVIFAFDSDDSAEQVSKSLANDGHTILSPEQTDPTYIKVRRE